MSVYGSGALGDWTTAGKTISSDGAAAAADVWVLGDSILRQCWSSLYADHKAATGRIMAVNAWSSRPTAAAVDALEDWLAACGGPPSAVVMATGSNDIFDPPVMAGLVDRALAAVGPDVPVVWVNTYVTRWGASGEDWAVRESDLRNTAWVNAQIADAAARHPNLHLVRWYEALCANPGYRITRWLTDGVHVTDLGRAARNSLTLSALRALVPVS